MYKERIFLHAYVIQISIFHKPNFNYYNINRIYYIAVLYLKNASFRSENSDTADIGKRYTKIHRHAQKSTLRNT